MKKYLIATFLLLCFALYGQNKREIKAVLSNINTKAELEKYKIEKTDWNIELIEINSSDKNVPKKFTHLKLGRVSKYRIDKDLYYYKLISNKEINEFRASYIYLNGSELSKEKIDSLRPIIISKYQAGAPFTDLVDEYNMDGNSKKGDLEWFKEGIMVPEFEKAVREHQLNDIFMVDVAYKKWYYVVLKTRDNRISNKMTMIRIKQQ